MDSRWRRLALFTLKTAVAAVLMFFVFRMVNIDELLTALKSADLLYIGIAVSLLSLNLGTRTLKWKLMLKAAGNEVTTWEAGASVLLGISFGSFTPGQIGEVGGRFLRVANAKAAHIVGLTLLDRTQFFLVLAMSGLTSYAFLTLQSSAAAIAVSIFCVTACFILFVRLEFIQRILEKLPFRFFRREWFVDFKESFSLLGKRAIASSLCYSFAFNIVLFLQMYFFMNAFGEVGAWEVFLGFSAMMFFKSLLPISIGDIGVREASTLYFFSLLGVSNVVALSAALLMFAVNMILPSLLGIFFLPSTKFYNPVRAEAKR
ncbi:MAG: flippase-like domain-containing protein [Ignavibacteriales bacterium]|nr:flippase-like domain-containing protein [Ignavibacteriales bacterium]